MKKQNASSPRHALHVLSCCGLLLGLAFCSGGLLLYSGAVWFNQPDKAVYPVRGVDVSHYQGDIDWQVLAAQDLSFAYIKATEGSGTVDERFAENWAEAQQTALFVGAYHFFSFDSSGQTQAENFIAAVPRTANSLPPVIDLEFYGDKSQNPPTRAEVDAILSVLIARLTDQYGVRPVIYTTESCHARYLSGAGYDCPLWIRDIYNTPKETDWSFWQYCNCGRLPGFSGEESRIDLNVYRGTRDEFLAQFSLTEK